MQKKFHTLLFVFTLGLFLLPGVTYACGTKTEKKCCSKEISKETPTKKCCKEKAPEKEAKDDCNGKCGHSNCTSTSVTSSFAVFTAYDFNSTPVYPAGIKHAFYNSETFISSGFSSLWLIPKIG